jgi:hypothetical protein
MLRDKLLDCGWREELKEHCKKVIREKGLDKVSIEDLVADITPKGRGKHIVILKIRCKFLIYVLLQRPYLILLKVNS